MKPPFQSLVEIHHKELLNLWENSVEVFSSLQPILKQHSDDIVTGFYQRLLQHPQATEFLTTEVINQRLRQGIKAWLSFTFYGPHTQTSQEFLEFQERLGRLHADMDIPLTLFLLGLRMLKQEIIQVLMELEESKRLSAVSYVDALIDLILAIIAESYNEEQGDMISELQRMRMSIPPENLQLVCEQMRNKLLMWFTHQLSAMHQRSARRSKGNSVVSLRESEIGLWLEHKAPLLFPENQTLDTLVQACEEIDSLLEQTRQLNQQHNEEEYTETIALLEELVKRADWLLCELAREISEIEGRKDPLTHLFNRRHLATVLNFESRKSRYTHKQYAILLIDLDHFKTVNDRYGHDIGDQVLKRFAELLSEKVRTSDFVFRYGGEEFLVLLPAVQEATAMLVAEKIRKIVEATPFAVPNDGTIQLTVSCGVALSGGELNYERTIKRADQALYQAKLEGRNCVVLALPPK